MASSLVGLPPGWESDYDGSRWFYTYRSTGHVQYRFPCAGDEFPHFVDAAAPPPLLAPEERLESQQQLRRHAASTPRMSATAAQPVSYVWDEGDDGTAAAVSDSTRSVKGVTSSALKHSSSSTIISVPPSKMLPPQVRIEAPAIAFDPLGLVAELPTEDTPMSRVELQPEPVEMADNSMPAELPARTPLEARPPAGVIPWRPDDRPAQGLDIRRAQHPPHHRRAASESRPEHAPELVLGVGSQPAYLPYVPGPREWGDLTAGARRTSGLAVQRQASLMMEPKPSALDLDLSTVPRVLKIANGNAQPRPPERDQPSQSMAPLDPPPPYRLADDALQKLHGPGVVPKFPSVLKPARGRQPTPAEQRRSLPPEKRTDVGCFPRTQGGHGQGRPNRPVSLVPGGRQSPYSELERQSASTTGQILAAAPPSSVAAPAYLPYRERPRPAAAVEGGRSELASNSQVMSGRGPRRHTAFTPREVSPIRSRSESVSSCQPPQTPSPLGSMRRGSSNSSILQGVGGGPWAGRQSPALGAQGGPMGPPVPGKIPIQQDGSDAVDPSAFRRSGPAAGRRQAPTQELPAGLRIQGPQRPFDADGRQQRLSLQAPASGWRSGPGGLQQQALGTPAWNAPRPAAVPVPSPAAVSPLGGSTSSPSSASPSGGPTVKEKERKWTKWFRSSTSSPHGAADQQSQGPKPTRDGNPRPAQAAVTHSTGDAVSTRGGVPRWMGW
ncbi:hypothetical protein GQ602_005335 [Ophiocordyceps camponoti-floridani]|uniref:WW domain-containing protein n=1 Tax=Ophiocordyceps camponoti-floridani TaxID=2030778 RepID=A0A8H4Q600_9HYPO|nr:hypothetical protein GQ602_005335 [Ophiocordyceps camponoti-floridani]